MKSRLKSLSLGLAAVLALTTSFLGSAHAWQRFNPVNTPAEARRDINHNGVVGPYDRAVLAERHYYRAVTSGPRVNTPLENRYDHNNNGWIGPRERYAINHRFVNTPNEVACDHNHNGIIGPGEVGCVY